MMAITIRKAEESDYPQILDLFKEFAAFEKLPEKMTNSVEKMLQVIAFGRSSQCRKLRWQVSGWNTPAIGFYKNIGAVIDHTEQNCDLLLN